ncbi:MAG: hypothetical protein PHU85_00665 [Phycisphaerae bacterium]|nr:hypothetical protein [Phycisphaerae bacterium]
MKNPYLTKRGRAAIKKVGLPEELDIDFDDNDGIVFLRIAADWSVADVTIWVPILRDHFRARLAEKGICIEFAGLHHDKGYVVAGTMGKSLCGGNWGTARLAEYQPKVFTNYDLALIAAVLATDFEEAKDGHQTK